MYSPQESAEILVLRAKVADNSITAEELKRGLALLQKSRAGAAVVSSKARTAKAAASKPIDSDGLLGELGAL